ncbi:hypothetical protein ACUXIW_003550 [Ralstonia pickettii]
MATAPIWKPMACVIWSPFDAPADAPAFDGKSRMPNLWHLAMMRKFLAAVLPS